MAADRHRVVIAGGGVAALEALLALRDLAGLRIEVTLVAPEREFLYRPVTVTEAFDVGEARAYPLGELLADSGGGKLVWDSLESVEPIKQQIRTGSGQYISYETLVVATGAVARAPLANALTFRGRTDVPELRAVLADLAAGDAGSVAFVVPSTLVWPLPIYELALMTADRVRESGSGAQVWLVTPEAAPLELFGPAAARAIEPMLAARGIRLRTSARGVFAGEGTLVLSDGSLDVDRVVTLPEVKGPAISGLPCDADGFIRVDGHGRVLGLEGVYAAGDATDFPLKQGGLAAQQADAVAQAIAADLWVPVVPEPFRPVLRGLLMTGGAPLYLRAEPQRLPNQPAGSHDAIPLDRRGRLRSQASTQSLWWPPAKIAGLRLAPFLATARPQPLGTALLRDRTPVPGKAVSEAEYEDALELALLLAECDAKWGDYRAALSALDSAQAIRGALPPEYEARRREWRQALKAA